MVARKGYKLTEVGEIPEDWEVIPWDNALSIVSGQVDPKASPYCDMILVAPDHIESESGRILKKETAKDQNAISGKYIFLKGDIVYSKIRPHLRKVYCPDFDGICSADMYPLRARQGFIHTLIFYILLGDIFSRFAESISARSGIPKINRRELSAYIFALPPTDFEQTAIATALSDADALIDVLGQCIAKKRHIKQGAMQELLTGKRRLPGFEGEWRKCYVENFGEVITGATPSTTVQGYWGGDYPWITPTDISSQRNIFTSERTLTQRGINVIRLLPPNAVLVTCIASIGKNTILKVFGGCNQQINAIIPNDEHHPDFLYFFMEFNKQTLLASAGTTATAILSKASFCALEFLIPTLDEQAAIAAVLTAMDDEIAALEAKLSKARQIKAGMMQELLTGRIRLV